jgi:hypothetical protein
LPFAAIWGIELNFVEIFVGRSFSRDIKSGAQRPAARGVFSASIRFFFASPWRA